MGGNRRQGGVRRRREHAGDVLDLDEERAGRPDALELLRNLPHLGQRVLARPVELLGEEHVLGRVDGVLEHPVDVDDVDPDELPPVPDPLEATSPMCATNFSFSLSACEHTSQGQRLLTTLRSSTWNARCMPAAAWVTAATGPPRSSVSALRDRNAASPSISISSKLGAASITASSSRAVFTSAWARLIRCVPM